MAAAARAPICPDQHMLHQKEMSVDGGGIKHALTFHERKITNLEKCVVETKGEKMGEGEESPSDFFG